LFTAEFLEILEATGVRSVKLPPRSPNLNAHAERFVRTTKESCLEQRFCSAKAPCGRPSTSLCCTTTALHYAHLAMSLINLGALGCVLLMRGLAYVHELAQPAAPRFRFPARDDSEPKGRRAVDARLQSGTKPIVTGRSRARGTLDECSEHAGRHSGRPCQWETC